jgi:hypothetical protein
MRDLTVKELASQLLETVNTFYSRYSNVDETSASARPGSEEWSVKEIIGHLIDSASNNHQRFIRMQLTDELIFPDYGRDNCDWVKIARYNEMNLSEVLLLWKQYNLLLAGIIKNLDPHVLEHYWLLDGEKVTLSFLAKDYLRHLKGHLQQFEDTLHKYKSG